MKNTFKNIAVIFKLKINSLKKCLANKIIFLFVVYLLVFFKFHFYANLFFHKINILLNVFLMQNFKQLHQKLSLIIFREKESKIIKRKHFLFLL